MTAEPRAALATGRTGRFRRGVLATLASQVVAALGQIVLVPVFLGAWGERLYGEWLTLSAIAGQMVLLDLGVHTFVVNRLNQCYARGDIGQFARVLHSALAWCLVLTTVAVAAVALAAFALPVEHAFRLELLDHPTAALVVSLLVLQIAASVPCGLVTGVYRTIGEYPRGMTLYNLQRALFFALTAACVVTGGSLVDVALVQLVPLVASLGWTLADLRRRHPEVSVGIAARDPRLARSFVGPSSLFLLIRTSQALSIQGPVLLAGALFGPAAVTPFVILRTLCNLVKQIAGSLANALWPELTALEARGQLETLRHVHALAVKVVTALSLAAAIVLHHCGAALVELWTGGELTHSAPLLDALLLLLVLQAPWTTSSIFLVATNRHRVVALCYAVSSVAGLGLGFLFARTHGLPGLVLGVLAAEACVCSWAVPNAACALVLDRPRSFFARVFLPALPIAGAAWFTADAAALLSSSLAPPAAIATVAATVALIVPALTWLAWLDADERGRVRKLVTRIASEVTTQ